MGTNNKGIYCMYVYVVSCVVSNFTVTGENDAKQNKVMISHKSCTVANRQGAASHTTATKTAEQQNNDN